MYDWNAKVNYFEEDMTAAEWFNHLCGRVNSKIFDRQEELLYMCNQTDNGVPKFREGAISQIGDIVIDELNWLIVSVIESMIVFHREQNIDLSEEMEDWLIELMGAEGYGAWEIEMRRKIIDDYASFFGRYRAEELAKKWWGDRKNEDGA